MIGGSDIQIPTRARLSAMDLCVRIIRRHWPLAVFDVARTGQRIVSYEQLPFGLASELLVYRDLAAAKRWDELGAEPATQNSMIHLLVDQAGVTVVVDDDPSDEMSAIVSEIRGCLQGVFAELAA